MIIGQCKISVFSTNLYQYTQVFQCDTSTFVYTNKFNQYDATISLMLLYYAEIMLLQRVTPLNYDLDRSATPLNVGELNG